LHLNILLVFALLLFPLGFNIYILEFANGIITINKPVTRKKS
jgi:hypothetical protein